MTALKIFLFLNFLVLCYGQISNQNQNATDEYYEDQYIERPCEVYDKFCIRKYLKHHSQCKETYRPVPDPLYRDQLTVYFSSVNLTVTAINVLYTGLNGRIDKFYINKKTDRLVLAVEFTNVTISSDSVYLRFHRNGQEPIVNQDNAFIGIQSVVVTITIPNLKDLQIGRSEVFAYVNDLPLLIFGPQGFVSEDPTVLQVAAELVASIPIVAREGSLTEGSFFIGSYMQYSLCDFGLATLSGKI